MGSILIPTVNKPTEGPCRLLKNVRWGILLPLDVVSKKGTNSPDPRFSRLHLCHMHSIMHSSIPPMKYRSFDLHQLLSHFSKHGNKSNRQEVLPSQGQKPRYHQHQGIRAVDGTPPNASLPHDFRKDLRVDHSKESPVVAVLADLFDTFDRRCEKNSARIICCLPALCVGLVSHLFQQDTRHPCPLLSHRSCTEKRRIDWDQLLAGIGGRTISWFPRWKEGKEGVLFSCGRYPNIPLVGTRGCINYNPALAIRQLGYPMRGAPTEESMSPFLVRDLGAQNSKTIQRIHKAWETPLRKDQELRGILS